MDEVKDADMAVEHKEVQEVPNTPSALNHVSQLEVAMNTQIALVAMISTCSFFVLILTTMCRHRQCSFKMIPLHRQQLQKVALYNIVNALLSAAVFYHIFLENSGEKTVWDLQCMVVSDHPILILLAYLIVILMTILRYISNQLAHSETYSVGGYTVHNPRQHVVKAGISGNNSTHGIVLCPFFMVAVVGFITLSITSFGLVPASIREVVMNFAVCVPEIEGQRSAKTLGYLSILLLMAWSFIFVEALFYCCTPNKERTPYKLVCAKIMNSPSTQTTLATTYSAWLSLVVGIWFFLAFELYQYIVLFQYYILIDSGFLVVVCMFTGLVADKLVPSVGLPQ